MNTMTPTFITKSGVICIAEIPEKPTKGLGINHPDYIAHDLAVSRAIEEAIECESQQEARIILEQTGKKTLKDYDAINKFLEATQRPNETFPGLSVPPYERVEQYRRTEKGLTKTSGNADYFVWLDCEDLDRSTVNGRYEYRTICRFTTEEKQKQENMKHEEKNPTLGGKDSVYPHPDESFDKMKNLIRKGEGIKDGKFTIINGKWYDESGVEYYSANGMMWRKVVSEPADKEVKRERPPCTDSERSAAARGARFFEYVKINPFEHPIASAKLKELVWKIDREVWAKVEVKEATTSWGREQTAKLICEYFGCESTPSEQPTQEELWYEFDQYIDDYGNIKPEGKSKFLIQRR